MTDCCGQGRVALVAARVSAGSAIEADALPSGLLDRPGEEPLSGLPSSSSIVLAYGGRRRLHVTGPASGKTYRFSASRRMQTVDPRDAPALLRHPFLRPR
jgi:hypothetical protein